jgi:hypothetical protein
LPRGILSTSARVGKVNPPCRRFGDVLHGLRAFHDYLEGYRRQFRVLSSHDDFFTVAIEML